MPPEYTPFPPSVVARFWSHIDTSGECWPWTASTVRGYGQFVVAKRRYIAHRFAWLVTYGAIPDRLHVLHDCPSGDNPGCCRPDHLWLGTQGENIRDMIRKGRQGWHKNRARGTANGMNTHPERRPTGDRHGFRLRPGSAPSGEHNGGAKLTSDMVRAIRARYCPHSTSQQSLATEYGVSQTTIGRILRRQLWSRL